jgi:hypothetical protein
MHKSYRERKKKNNDKKRNSQAPINTQVEKSVFFFFVIKDVILKASVRKKHLR